MDSRILIFIVAFIAISIENDGDGKYTLQVLLNRIWYTIISTLQ